jgi:hypothetical protein
LHILSRLQLNWIITWGRELNNNSCSDIDTKITAAPVSFVLAIFFYMCLFGGIHLLFHRKSNQPVN